MTPQASHAEITHAYRRLIRRHHPDTRAADNSAPDHDAELQELINAYAMLNNPVQRATYDQHQRPSPPRPTATHSTITHRLTLKDPDKNPPIIAGPVYWQPPSPNRRRPT